MTTQALLFVDVVDSTDLVQRLGDAVAATVWSTHDHRARELMTCHRGREIDHTDGFFVLFQEVADAARYALAYHAAMGDIPVTARIGIHVGPVIFRDNAADDIHRGAKPIEVEGLAKPLAARIMALAAGGQTLMSGVARRLLGDDLPDYAEVVQHGHYRLKGVEAPVEIFELGTRGKSRFAPPADAEKAYRVFLSGNDWLPVREVRNNVPTERNAFVGRKAELRGMSALVQGGARLLTVLGPGGIGKTRFVQSYCRARLGDWPGGVYFCDLSDCRSLDGIAFAVASVLGVPLGKENPIAQLGNAMAGRGRCLIVLDNFEQVVEHAAASAGTWLDWAIEATFIVTSRERLHLRGEDIFPLEPLGLAHEAIELFAIRARSHKPAFTINDANRSAVAEVVQLLEGLPLAIELAAARSSMLTPAQLVERMGARFQLLAGSRNASSRQATLRAAIDWSWGLLTPFEQRALAQCSIFEGGFTLEAAESVVDLAAWPEAPATVDVIQSLFDKSLLRVWVPAGHSSHDVEEPHFAMYVSIREYAAEKLQVGEAGLRLQAEERHGSYFASFGRKEAIEALTRHGGVRKHRTLAIQIDNLIAACHRAVARGDAEVAVHTYCATWQVLHLLGPCEVGATLGAEVLSMVGLDASQRGATAASHALALREIGRTDAANTGYTEAVALSRQAGDLYWEGIALCGLGNLRRSQGEMAQARALLEEALSIARTSNRRLEGVVLSCLAIVDAEQGRLQDARPLFEQAVEIHRDVGDRRFEGVDIGNLGTLAREQGRLSDAAECYREAQVINREVGNRREEGIVTFNQGCLLREQGEPERASALFEAAIAIFHDLGARTLEGLVLAESADVLCDLGRVDAALIHCNEAINRAVGNRRSEGEALGVLGRVLGMQGRIDEARDALQRGETLLREASRRPALAGLLGERGHLELIAGDLQAAREALLAAEAEAQATGAGNGTTAVRRITALREALR
jgi:predicted ATPase/class 3 adenylate cyclase